MVLVRGGNTAIRVPLHTSSGDPVRRLSLGGVGLLDLRGPGSTYAAPTAMTAPVTAAMAGSGLGIADVDELDVIGVKPPAARSATAIPGVRQAVAA